MKKFGPTARKSGSGSPKAERDCIFQIARRPGRPTTADAENLGDHILTEGWNVLLDEGFERFTFDRLARRARVGKPTIYARFPNKRAFLSALLLHRIQTKREAVIALGDGVPFVEALAKQGAHAMNSILSPEGRLIERLMDWLDEEEDGAACGSVRQAVYQSGLVQIREQFVAAMQRGEARFADVDQAAQLWIEAMVGHARLMATGESATPGEHEAWSRRFSEFFLKGLDASPA